MSGIERLLVANRGEIARRVMRTCREMGIATVAVFSDPDSGAPFVREADEAVRLPGASAAETYLRGDAIVEAARRTGADAVHPGYGFLSENHEFVHACEDNDLVFIGPPADVMARMGDKALAKAEMRAAGVPLVPGTDGTASLAAARVASDELGYPVLLKAAAGGGGRGMRRVDSAGELEDAYASASAEAEAAFSDGTLYVEKVIAPARHVEIQVLCDEHGAVL
ncbi:MAG TPA: biotin carboxylase N-terminal domain-containing protein, partial [Candidatus Dormibacteraeota bacterium]|nr:biotin carboxylase N-terminal domain-containing protein [Candidatus Dormibacteraeota bacterium]